MGRALRVGIRKDHDHDGKTCYATFGDLRDAGMLSDGSLVAYRPYTGSWYVFDADTGKQIATIDREFYDGFIRLHRIGDLVPDPDCVVQS